MKDTEAERRLLDMLAGWAEFANEIVYHNRDTAVSMKEADVIADFYQDVANLEDKPDAIKEFIETKIIPFILTGKR